MRIAHVVTYVSADGAFGGPVAVAAGHAEELARRGHEVELLAGWDGKAQFSVPGVRVGLFRTRRIAPGLSGLTAFGLLAHLRAHARDYDVIHVHMGRDMVTLPAAVMAGVYRTPAFVQTHGMVMPDDRKIARIVDYMLTRRVLRRAQRVFVLTEAEASGIEHVVGGNARNIAHIPNGVARRTVDVDRQSDPPVVLFLARLHPRKRVLAFAEAARVLSERGVRAEFRVIGPDEGDLEALMRFQEEHDVRQLSYLGPIAPGRSVDALAQATVYVLPSRGEVFPMTVLESFVAATPVVLAEDCAIAQELRSRGSVLTTTGAAGDLALVIENLLINSAQRSSLVESANRSLTDWLSIEAVADRLEEAYA